MAIKHIQSIHHFPHQGPLVPCCLPDKDLLQNSECSGPTTIPSIISLLSPSLLQPLIVFHFPIIAFYNLDVTWVGNQILWTKQIWPKSETYVYTYFFVSHHRITERHKYSLEFILPLVSNGSYFYMLDSTYLLT